MKEVMTDRPNIVKTDRGVLINKDNEGLAAYKLRKLQSHKFKMLENDVKILKQQLEEIKRTLEGLTNK